MTHSQAIAAVGPTEQAKILVVEDDPDIRKILELFLGEKGFRVKMADGAPRALDLPGVDSELEDLDVRERHAGLLLLHPDLPVLPLLHRFGDQVVGRIEPPILEGLQVPPDGLLGGERRWVRGGRPRDDEEHEGAERARKPARAGHGAPYHRPPARRKPATILQRRHHFFAALPMA